MYRLTSPALPPCWVVALTTFPAESGVSFAVDHCVVVWAAVATAALADILAVCSMCVAIICCASYTAARAPAIWIACALIGTGVVVAGASFASAAMFAASAADAAAELLSAAPAAIASLAMAKRSVPAAGRPDAAADADASCTSTWAAGRTSSPIPALPSAYRCAVTGICCVSKPAVGTTVSSTGVPFSDTCMCVPWPRPEADATATTSARKETRARAIVSDPGLEKREDRPLPLLFYWFF